MKLAELVPVRHKNDDRSHMIASRLVQQTGLKHKKWWWTSGDISLSISLTVPAQQCLSTQHLTSYISTAEHKQAMWHLSKLLKTNDNVWTAGHLNNASVSSPAMHLTKQSALHQLIQRQKRPRLLQKVSKKKAEQQLSSTSRSTQWQHKMTAKWVCSSQLHLSRDVPQCWLEETRGSTDLRGCWP